MDEQAQIMALNKASAEIIFNITKEAAVRVIMSEQRALALQKDLDFTKQEALPMLLRLQQTFEATTSKAQITSLNQSRRIAELEARLNETEGKILDLRAEISQAHDQLDTVENSNGHWKEATNGTASHVDKSSVLQKFSRKHKKEAATNPSAEKKWI